MAHNLPEPFALPPESSLVRCTVAKTHRKPGIPPGAPPAPESAALSSAAVTSPDNRLRIVRDFQSCQFPVLAISGWPQISRAESGEDANPPPRSLHDADPCGCMGSHSYKTNCRN